MRLSAPGLQAALEAVGRPLLGEALQLVFARARARPLTERVAPALVVLPANLPGLALQSLLPALARRRPALYKSPSVEPGLTPAVLRAAARHEPALADAYAAAVWRGGDSPLERIALERCDPVIAYGDQPALDDLAKRARGRVVGFGPAFSIALLHRDPTDAEVAGLARDVALADQRGCLSVHAALTMGDAGGLARRLAVALATLSVELPPGRPDLAVAAAARQVVDDASARGLPVHGSLERGVAVVGATGEVAPSPGHRLARVIAVRDPDEALALLEPWRGRLQGAVLLPAAPATLAAGLVGLGVSRIAAPGELQLAGPEWRNGDVDLLEVF
jgi:acyl-CoA reductase-like NAD-dependent aldehyde dehydrogenase